MAVTDLRIGSLCSGYGGLDLGVQAVLGGDVAWHVEYDKDPSRILDHHWPDVPNHGDVKLTDWAAVEPVDILTAGYPCQPFSHAGKRKGADDPRHLWPDVARAVSVLRPRLVVLENVRGHVSLGLADVLGDLSALGYDAAWGVVRASDAGAPHARARVFIVARPSNTEGDGRHEGWAESAGILGGPDDAVRGDGDAADAQDGRWASLVPGGPGPERPEPASDRGAAQDADGAVGRERGVAASGQAEGGRARPSAPAVDEVFPTPNPFQLGNNESPADWIARRADVVLRTGTHHGLPLPVAAWSIAEGHPIRLSDPTSWSPDHAEPGRFGPYEGAVARWEGVLRRTAPDPTRPDGREGRPRLSPAFVEWMMGLDAGHVTDVPELSRNAQLKALGNGVVPQQAALALRLLLPLLGE